MHLFYKLVGILLVAALSSWITACGCSSNQGPPKPKKSAKKSPNKKAKKFKGKKRKFKMSKKIGPWNAVTVTATADPETRFSVRLDQKRIVGRRPPGHDVRTKSNAEGKGKVQIKNIRPGQYTIVVQTELNGKNVLKSKKLVIAPPEFNVSVKKNGADDCASCLSSKCNVELKLPGMKKPTLSEAFTVYGGKGGDKTAVEITFKGGKKASASVPGVGARKTAYTFKKNKLQLPLSMDTILGGLTLAAFASKSRPVLKFTIETNEKPRVSGKVLCALPEFLAKRFSNEANARKGLKMAGDPGQKGSASALVHTKNKGKTSRMVIGAGPLNTLDYLAYSNKTQRKHSPCAYGDKRTGKRVSLPRSSEQAKISIYDRRSGKKVHSKTLSSGTPSCPKTVRSSKAGLWEFVTDVEVKSHIKFRLRELGR